MSPNVEFISRCMPSEKVPGDAAMFRQEGDWTLFAVVDGLGHGAKAHEAASKGIEALQSVTPEASIEEVMHELDASMRGTRGGAATVCILRGDQLSGCGVGNVEIRTRSARVPCVLTQGILGRHVRNFRYFRGSVKPGSRIALFSDGISARFALSELDPFEPREACEMLLSQHGRDNDDATVMVVDIGG